MGIFVLSIQQTILQVASITDLDKNQKKQAISQYFSRVKLGLQRKYLTKEAYLIGHGTIPFELLTHQNNDVSALYLHLLVLAQKAGIITPSDIIVIFSANDAKGINAFLSYLLNAEVAHLSDVKAQISGWMMTQIHRLQLLHKAELIDQATVLKCIIGSDDMPFLLFSGATEDFLVRYVQLLICLSAKKLLGQDHFLQLFGRNLLPRLLEKDIPVYAFYHAMKCLNRLLIKNCMQPDLYKTIVLDPQLPTGRFLHSFLFDAPPTNYLANFTLYLDGLKALYEMGHLSKAEYIGLFTQKDCSGLTIMQQLLNLEDPEFIQWFLNGIEKMQPFKFSSEDHKALFFVKQSHDPDQPIFRDDDKKEAAAVNVTLDKIREVSCLNWILEMSEENFLAFTKRQCFFKPISNETPSTRLALYSPKTVLDLGF